MPHYFGKITEKPIIHDEADLTECPFCGFDVPEDELLEAPFSGEKICGDCFAERGFVVCGNCESENDPQDCPNCMQCGGEL